ncbi:MAG: riboflavin biosynthesis protein RibD [Nonomuraea sp.]|nr:riboflavin biosynthesis protein RibD [Nonomuraea sp.]
MTNRLVTANISLSLDGRYSEMGAIVPYAVTETGRNHLALIHEHATTAVLGRGSAQGFIGYWSQVAADEDADPRDRGYARWLVGTEKVVLSTTLTEAPWDHARIANAPAAEVIAELRKDGEGDILVNTSPSIIKPLLEADLVDRLFLMITPEIAGTGQRLFDDGLPATRWKVSRQSAGELGELSLIYDRVRH